MNSLQHFDLCIGEALEKCQEASRELREYKDEVDFPTQEILKHIGMAVLELWYTRDIVYARKPELKREFKKEFDENPKRYEELSEQSSSAYELEMSGDLSGASEIYKRLLEESKFGFFKLVAEAGLYRCETVNSKSCG